MQYASHPHLLARGRVTAGVIMSTGGGLADRPRGRAASTGWIIAVFMADLSFADARVPLEKVIEDLRVIDTHPDEAARDGFASLQRRLRESGPFPLRVPVPSVLAGGRRAYCSAMLVPRHDLPLGHLRRRWIPLLVDPASCQFTMVLPMQFWDDAWRRAWKREVLQRDRPTELH